GVRAKSKNMNTKDSIDFRGYTAAEVGPLAHKIHGKMTANPATFANPPVTMAALQTLADDYDAKFIARASRATADVLAFNAARDELEQTLAVLGNYVNGVAKGDAVIVEQSGFPSYTTGHTVDTAPP